MNDGWDAGTEGGWAWIRAHARGVWITLAVLAGGYWWMNDRPVSPPPGVLVPEDPAQTAPESPDSWRFRKHRITPLAQFDIRARILSRERYWFDRAAELSPLDLALGWGPMSDTQVLQHITIRQSGRWYYWSSSSLPISAGEIVSHSANMHMIPASDAVARRLLAARVGQIVHLEGDLVRADGPDQWHWISSLSRTDTGDGSCEVVWVTHAEVSDR